MDGTCLSESVENAHKCHVGRKRRVGYGAVVPQEELTRLLFFFREEGRSSSVVTAFFMLDTCNTAPTLLHCSILVLLKAGDEYVMVYWPSGFYTMKAFCILFLLSQGG